MEGLMFGYETIKTITIDLTEKSKTEERKAERARIREWAINEERGAMESLAHMTPYGKGYIQALDDLLKFLDGEEE
jgi:hypothetical protein